MQQVDKNKQHMPFGRGLHFFRSNNTTPKAGSTELDTRAATNEYWGLRAHTWAATAVHYWVLVLLKGEVPKKC